MAKGDFWRERAVRDRIQRRDALARLEATMTLGDAMEWLNQEPFGCACPGPPICCFDYTRQAEALVRGAHITAKLMQSAAAKQAGYELEMS